MHPFKNYLHLSCKFTCIISCETKHLKICSNEKKQENTQNYMFLAYLKANIDRIILVSWKDKLKCNFHLNSFFCVLTLQQQMLEL